MLPKMGNRRSLLKTPAKTTTTININSLTRKRLLRVLLDYVSRKTLIHRSALPKGIVTMPINGATLTTLVGKMSATEMVTMRDFYLPEFDKNIRIEEQKSLVFDTPCRYGIKLGTDLLSKAGIKINYGKGSMEWFESLLPLREPSGLNVKTFDDIEDALLIQQKNELFGEDWLYSYAT